MMGTWLRIELAEPVETDGRELFSGRIAKIALHETRSRSPAVVVAMPARQAWPCRHARRQVRRGLRRPFRSGQAGHH